MKVAMVYHSLGSRVSDSVALQNLALATVYASLVPVLDIMWPVVWRNLVGGDPKNEDGVKSHMSRYAVRWALFAVIGECSAIQYIKWRARPFG